jgi:hypothetical protein
LNQIASAPLNKLIHHGQNYTCQMLSHLGSGNCAGAAGILAKVRHAARRPPAVRLPPALPCRCCISPAATHLARYLLHKSNLQLQGKLVREKKEKLKRKAVDAGVFTGGEDDAARFNEIASKACPPKRPSLARSTASCSPPPRRSRAPGHRDGAHAGVVSAARTSQGPGSL